MKLKFCRVCKFISICRGIWKQENFTSLWKPIFKGKSSKIYARKMKLRGFRGFVWIYIIEIVFSCIANHEWIVTENGKVKTRFEMVHRFVRCSTERAELIVKGLCEHGVMGGNVVWSWLGTSSFYYCTVSLPVCYDTMNDSAPWTEIHNQRRVSLIILLSQALVLDACIGRTVCAAWNRE